MGSSDFFGKPKLALFLDFDDCMYINGGHDYGPTYNADQLRLLRIHKFMHPYMIKILCTGRQENQHGSLMHFLVTNGIVIPKWNLWGDIYDDDRNLFFPKYWKWKIDYAWSMHNYYDKGILMLDDDTVIIEMAKRMGIPCCLVNLYKDYLTIFAGDNIDPQHFNLEKGEEALFDLATSLLNM